MRRRFDFESECLNRYVETIELSRISRVKDIDYLFFVFPCPNLAILEGAFPTNLPLQHMQKDLKLSLSMGDQLEQPLPVSAAANEVYKHAKRLGYADHDVSAVYIRARF